ncbi:MAG: hypothetical protein AB8B95_01265 [Pseudohongiellaceae bacterium]
MAINNEDNIVLSGLDWSSKLRDVVLDVQLWHKIINWQGERDKALRWVQLQIKLFSTRHPDHSSLSHIISSIAFVEMAKPTQAERPEHWNEQPSQHSQPSSLPHPKQIRLS